MGPEGGFKWDLGVGFKWDLRVVLNGTFYENSFCVYVCV